MVDTVRSIAALLALLADNTTRAIDPQDLRDVLVSLSPGIGGMYVSTPAATTIGGISTPTKAAGTTAIVLDSRNFDMPTDNRLRYTGTAPALVMFVAGVSITCASSSQETTMSVALNGSELAHTVAQRTIGTGTDIGRAVILGFAEMNQNEYLEFFVSNETSTGAITVENMTFAAVSLVS